MAVARRVFYKSNRQHAFTANLNCATELKGGISNGNNVSATDHLPTISFARLRKKPPASTSGSTVVIAAEQKTQIKVTITQAVKKPFENM